MNSLNCFNFFALRSFCLITIFTIKTIFTSLIMKYGPKCDVNFPFMQLRAARIFPVNYLYTYTWLGAIVCANVRSSKDTYNTEIVIAAPYNNNIDIIQDRFQQNCWFCSQHNLHYIRVIKDALLSRYTSSHYVIFVVSYRIMYLAHSCDICITAVFLNSRSFNLWSEIGTCNICLNS